MRNCEICGQIITKKRLKVLPETTTCVKCSDEVAKTGYVSWHKATPELCILDEGQAKRIKKLHHYDGCNFRL